MKDRLGMSAIPEAEDDDGSNINDFTNLNPTYHSHLSALSDPSNRELAELFRRGYIGDINPDAPLTAPVRHVPRFDVRTLWNGVEAKPRGELLRYVKRAAEDQPTGSLTFVQAAEALLQHFIRTSEVPPSSVYAGAFSAALGGASPRVVTVSSTSKDLALELPLSEGYHRLLMHGIAQFYTLNSMSIVVPSSALSAVPGSKTKVLRVFARVSTPRDLPISLHQHLTELVFGPPPTDGDLESPVAEAAGAGTDAGAGGAAGGEVLEPAGGDGWNDVSKAGDDALSTGSFVLVERGDVSEAETVPAEDEVEDEVDAMEPSASSVGDFW